jgi:hypothetical protein
MIRERVLIHGLTRPMEPREELQALKLQPGQVGLIKEGPVVRWLEGQEIWDRRYKRNAEGVIKERRKIETKARRLLDNARAQGLIYARTMSEDRGFPRLSTTSSDRADGIRQDRRWSPFDLEGE